MSFKELKIKKEYRSLLDNMAKEFYIPLLKETLSYKRAVGFFASSILVEISKGILNLVKNGGHIQIITSPKLTDEDINAIRAGYADRKSIVKNAIKREIKSPEDDYQSDKLNLLANLISDGILDIKIAITEENNRIGMYHEKVGIMIDREGNKIAFSGSMNETANALLANYETIDVFCDWNGEEERVKAKETAFDAIWNKMESHIITYDMDEISDELIQKYRTSIIDYNKYDDSKDIIVNEEQNLTFFKVPKDVEFYEYQKQAISKWIDRGFCGIYDMATGSGKTYTALGSICQLSKILKEKIAVIIVAPYQHLVEQWVDDIIDFNVKPIVAYSYPGQNWRTEFNDSVIGYNVGVINNFCVITTNATFSSNDFQEILKKFKKHFCFVVDEAHNIGASKIGQLLPKKARYRLGLSATIERFGDESGTETIYKYFGYPPCIKFSLKDAIDNKFLTPYNYHPILVYLNSEELDAYNELTRQIIISGARSIDKSERNTYLELLLIKRARIIAGCKEKVDKLLEIMEPFKNDSHILVYCGATKYDRNDLSDDSQIRQIDEINYRLYADLGMKVRKFTSTENKKDRKEIKELFVTEGIQVITAIKCLDEGVNIPAINKAFILASSTNPKEYIQRRGRVLRKYPGKTYADIYDFITLPRRLTEVKYCNDEEKKMDLSLVRHEFERLEEFAEAARDSSVAYTLKEKILDAYNFNIYEGTVKYNG